MAFQTEKIEDLGRIKLRFLANDAESGLYDKRMWLGGLLSQPDVFFDEIEIAP